VGIDDTSLPQFSLLLQEARTARTSWASWKWWQLTHPGKDQLLQLAQANGLSTSEQDLDILAQKLVKQQTLVQLRPQVTMLLTDISRGDSPAQTATLLKHLHQAHALAARFADIQALHNLTPMVWVSATTFTDTVRTILGIADEISRHRVGWQKYLTDQQIDRLWQQDLTAADGLRRSLRSDFDLLVEADRLRNSFSETEQLVLKKLVGQSGDQFFAALRLAWLNHLERHYPQLRSVSSLRMKQIEESLQTSVQRKTST